MITMLRKLSKCGPIKRMELLSSRGGKRIFRKVTFKTCLGALWAAYIMGHDRWSVCMHNHFTTQIVSLLFSVLLLIKFTRLTFEYKCYFIPWLYQDLLARKLLKLHFNSPACAEMYVAAVPLRYSGLCCSHSVQVTLI